MVIGTYCIGSCKKHYHPLTTRTVPIIIIKYFQGEKYTVLMSQIGKRHINVYNSIVRAAWCGKGKAKKSVKIPKV